MDTNTQKNSRMTYIKEILILRPQVIGFSSMVLCHAAVLLLLTHSCRGQSQVTAPSLPIVAMVGDDIILPCYLEPAVNAADLTVEWARPDLEPRFVHLRRDGVELLFEEHPSYLGRTSLSVNKLKRGDISLKLSKVKLSDAGTYRCLVPTSGTDSGVNLAVGSVSSPEIDISTVSKGVMLDCKSKGWYPEPEVFWLDGEGNLLSAGPTETVRGPDDLYTVSSRVTVEKRHSNSFTCRVQQKDINQTRETHIQVPADLFMVKSRSALHITICLSACIMSIIEVVFVLWKWGQNKINTEVGERMTRVKRFGNTTELQLLMEGERDVKLLQTDSEKMKYLDKTKAKVDEKLQKKEEELQHVKQWYDFQNSRMFRLKDGCSPKPRLCTFNVLVFHHTMALLLLTHCCKGQSQVIAPRQPILAVVGDDIILPCHLEPAMDVASTAVEWSRPDLKPRFVHVKRSGQELLDDQHPSYRGRTSLFNKKLQDGDISLKLSKVKLSDRGTYRCFVPILNRDSTVELFFGSVSSPEINISTVSKGVMLDCKSKGCYPEPEAFWLDGEGNLLSAGPTETVRGPDDLYTVSSRVTVEKRHNNSFTCRVQQKDINQIRDTHIQVPAELFMVQSSFAVRITICLAVCIMSVVAVVFILWKWGQNKINTKWHHEGETEVGEKKTWITTFGNSTELQLLMEGEREQLMTESEKMKYLNKTKAKLDEEFEKNGVELEHVQQLITTLTEQKKDLRNQREKLISLQQEDKIKIQEYEKKLTTKPKTDKHKKKKKREMTKEFLEKRATEHEELLKNTEELLETTDNLIIRMTERKGKLEKDKEQINKYLKETERQREEVQRKLQAAQSEREEEINETLSEPERETHLTTEGGQDTDTAQEEAGDETKNGQKQKDHKESRQEKYRTQRDCNLIMRMTERKWKLEKDKKQINKYLEETERRASVETSVRASRRSR
ncbi:uncharacterized protein LOC119912525 isoform X1 [Micropterus salmoides]|uniref:uncharacterized protein LOC119912525 isoform X1 n=2 Tax=Micropterus salmoides TaxID=27706 RepID=UPI0018EDCC34|nr:uncharacterized protein LOC119912525 isoform X1 [Micropterus salmoides]